MSESFYRYHVFFCTNQRADDEQCCQNHNAQAMRDYMKQRAKELDLINQGVRINTAGCLNRCELGPILVIYPQAIWYTYVDKEDIEDILQQHLQQGQIVKRLQVDN